MGTFSVTSRLSVSGVATVLLLLRMGQASSPLMGYPPLADAVHELRDCHYTPLDTRSEGQPLCNACGLFFVSSPSNLTNGWE